MNTLLANVGRRMGRSVAVIAAFGWLALCPSVSFAQATPETPEAKAPAKQEEKKADKPAGDQKKDEKKRDSLSNRTITGQATRVAYLNFGPPAEWKDTVESTVGPIIAAKDFKAVIPMLEADKTDVVVIKINSGGGALSEMAPFQRLFQNDYKSRFRTVMWIHSAISCAAMSPWPIEEIYMEPEGNIGACTGWFGNLTAVKGMELLQVLEQMREVSGWAGRDYRIMRSMQIQEPLSANVDEFGNVEYFQDATSGKILLNPPGQILTFNAVNAVQVRFAKGVAANEDELMKAMNIAEFEVVGQKATKLIQDAMKRNHKIEKETGENVTKFFLAYNAARGLRGENNRDLRGVEVGKARQALAIIRRNCEANNSLRSNYQQQFQVYMTPEWFEEMDRDLRRILQDR